MLQLLLSMVEGQQLAQEPLLKMGASLAGRITRRTSAGSGYTKLHSCPIRKHLFVSKQEVFNLPPMSTVVPIEAQSQSLTTTAMELIGELHQGLINLCIIRDLVLDGIMGCEASVLLAQKRGPLSFQFLVDGPEATRVVLHMDADTVFHSERLAGENAEWSLCLCKAGNVMRDTR